MLVFVYCIFLFLCACYEIRLHQNFNRMGALFLGYYPLKCSIYIGKVHFSNSRLYWKRCTCTSSTNEQASINTPREGVLVIKRGQIHVAK